MDVTTTAGRRVVAQSARDRAGEHVQRARDRRSIERTAVPEHQTRQGYEVGRGPVAVDVRFTDPDVGAHERPSKKTFVANDKRGVEIRRLSESVRPAAAFHAQNAG